MAMSAALANGPSAVLDFGAEVTVLPDHGVPGAASILVRGPLRAGWCSAFAMSAAQHRLWIISGRARRDRNLWEAEFHVEAPHREADGVAERYARLLDGPTGWVQLHRVVLLRNEVERETSGRLSVRVRAHDRVGLLASLLDKLAEVGLFPDELDLETPHGVAEVCLQLSGFGGQRPTFETEHALRTTLDAHTC
jgi:hypothetical protein